jgi:adenosine deaminase
MTGLPNLHCHLDGSIRPDTLRALADPLGLSVPSDLPFSAGMGLVAALERFAFTLALLQTPAAVRRVADELCVDSASDGVTTLEIRFAPQLHRGAAIPAIVDAALEGVAGRATLLLCALYGEDPAVAEALVDVAASRPGVVGLDLAGGPAPSHSWALADYAPAFRRAGAVGLGRTVHAGEGRPPHELLTAIDRLGAERIGHGTTLLDDTRVLKRVLDAGVTIEACLTSNWHVGAIPSITAHPLVRWLELGVRACVNPDNTLLSAVTASQEHARAAALPGMTQTLLTQAITNGHTGAFRRG